MDPLSNNHQYVSNQEPPKNEVPLDKESDLIPEDSVHPVNNQFPNLQNNQEVQLPSQAEVNQQHPLDSPITVNPPQVQYQAGNYNMNNNQPMAIPPLANQPAPVLVSNQYQMAQPVMVASQQKKVIYTGKPFPAGLAYACLIINLFLPGIGTMIGTCGMNDRNMKVAYICSGCCQLITFICLIGWCFALCTSILYIVASQSDEPFESYLANKEGKKEVQIAMVNIPSNQNYMNVINNVGYQSGTLNNPPQGQQIVMEKAQNYASL